MTNTTAIIWIVAEIGVFFGIPLLIGLYLNYRDEEIMDQRMRFMGKNFEKNKNKWL